MRAVAYYNEPDLYAADWLCNLIDAGHIARGVVDTRSIEDVTPDDLLGFTQCHFFAGIGIWSLALRRAGWPDDRPVWTGSCPCQPFSAAGAGLGFADERHLWPAWYYLIRKRKPSKILGEQVAGAGGPGWLDLVQSDLESSLYAVGKIVLSAAGCGADHIRERIYFAANAERAGQPRQGKFKPSMYPATNPRQEADGLVDALCAGTLPYLCGRHDVHPRAMEQLRAYGNALDAETARQFIETVMESI